MRFTFPFPHRERLNQIINHIFAVLKDSPLWEEGRGQWNGKVYQNTGKGVRGGLFHWNNPGEQSQKNEGEALISIPGSSLISLTQQQIHELICYLVNEAHAKCTRVDIAVDDYEKAISFETMREALEAGEYAGFNKYTPIKPGNVKGENLGFTIYLGSRQSDFFWRYYDKEVESKGLIKSHRLEAELKGNAAQSFVSEFVSLAYTDELAAKFLAGCVIGKVRFCERPRNAGQKKNKNRRKDLDWWTDFTDRVGATVKLGMNRVDPTLQSTVNWVERQVTPTLAVLRSVLGVLDFRAFLDNLVDEKAKNLSEVNEAKVQVWSQSKHRVFGSIKRKPFPLKPAPKKEPSPHKYTEPPSVFLPGTWVRHELTGIIRKVIASTHTHTQLEGEQFAVSVHVLSPV